MKRRARTRHAAGAKSPPKPPRRSRSIGATASTKSGASRCRTRRADAPSNTSTCSAGSGRERLPQRKREFDGDADGHGTLVAHPRAKHPLLHRRHRLLVEPEACVERAHDSDAVGIDRAIRQHDDFEFDGALQLRAHGVHAVGGFDLPDQDRRGGAAANSVLVVAWPTAAAASDTLALVIANAARRRSTSAAEGLCVDRGGHARNDLDRLEHRDGYIDERHLRNVVHRRPAGRIGYAAPAARARRARARLVEELGVESFDADGNSVANARRARDAEEQDSEEDAVSTERNGGAQRLGVRAGVANVGYGHAVV